MRMMEELESRQLFATVVPITVAASAGTLTITGTAYADSITISEKNQVVSVLQGTTSRGTFSAITQIVVNSLAGIDTIKYTGYSQGVIMDAGAGADIITVYDYSPSTATVRSSIFGGADADKITFYASYAGTVHGGDGIDTIAIQGGKYVDVWGDAGADSISLASGASYTTIHKDAYDKITNRGLYTTIVSV